MIRYPHTRGRKPAALRKGATAGVSNVPGKRVTLQDIARATGYTANTVSHALKDKPDIAPQTREHIQNVARQMGYVRNEMAGALRSCRTKTLGLIVGGMSNPFYSKMTDDIQDEAMAAGYSLMIFCSRDDPDLEYRLLETAISRQVDGILLFPCRGSQRGIDRMRALNIPYVLMSRYLVPGQDDCVVCDEEQGGYLATMHLIQAGRRPGYIYRFDAIYSAEERKKGFLRACGESGLSSAPYAMCKTDEEVCRLLLRWREQGINGLFLFCDQEAWSAYSLLSKMHLRIPEDFAIVGYDNVQGAWPLPSALCSVDYRTRDMVRSGIALLMHRMSDRRSAPETIVFQPRIICRGSCGK